LGIMNTEILILEHSLRLPHSSRPVCSFSLAPQAAGAGGVAAGSVGEAPDPASPRGEGSKRARTSTSPGDTGCPPRPLITARHASRTAMVSSPELLEHVFTFLAGGKTRERRDLGHAALVCRSWRDAALGEELWGRVASEVMPAMRPRVSEVGARRCVVERGLCHRDKRAWVGHRCWFGVRLQVEVWDNLDETCLPAHPHMLSLAGTDRVEVVCPAFSAASRDPVRRRFASINDYFRRGPDTVEKGVLTRVYVKDERRGRQALLWEHFFRLELGCMDVAPTDRPDAALPAQRKPPRHTRPRPAHP
jgi:hypothetical protein